MLGKNCRRIIFNSIRPQTLLSSRQRSFCTVSSTMCYYDVLNVKRTATIAEIKSAYYEKVKMFHPDTNQTSSAEESFKIIARAYEVLRDPALRSQYDAKKESKSHSKHTSSSGANTAYADYDSSFYGSHKTDTTSTKKNYSYQSNWEDHSFWEKARDNAWHNQQKTHTQRNESFFSSLVVKIGMFVGVFFFLDLYKRLKPEEQQPVKAIQAKMDPMSLGQVDFGATMGWRPMSQEKLQEEIKKKGFRIEYHTVQHGVSKEAHKANRTYRKERKIADLDEFVEKRNFKVEKSKAV